MDVNATERLRKIISDKVWQRYDNFFIPDQTMEYSLLSFMAKMNSEQQNLFFSILEDYLIITEYRDDARDILSQLLEVVPQQSNIIVCALFAYEIKNVSQQSNKGNIQVYDSPFSQKFQGAQGYKVIVDDFIGSGDQFLGIADDLRKQGLSSHFDAVASIVIQNEGKSRIEVAGYNVICAHVRGKCLADSAIENAYELNDSVEKQIGVFPSMKRGYNQSEAAVTLRRTPNNTLPAFWLKGSSNWPAPFPR